MDELCVVLCSLETFINMDLIDLISSEKITVKEEVYPEMFHFKKLPKIPRETPAMESPF